MSPLETHFKRFNLEMGLQWRPNKAPTGAGKQPQSKHFTAPARAPKIELFPEHFGAPIGAVFSPKTAPIGASLASQMGLQW